ncbi:MAG TPA: nickel-binding protein [Vicinamibacterales bacterium]|nr:nickel-binding protein [Vicinamibacterales bacterium]
MVHLIVEQTFETPLTDEEHGRLGRTLDKCLEVHGARWMRSYLSTDRRRLVCEFEAADAEAVRTSYRSAGINFDRVWTAELYAREATANQGNASA